MNQSNDKLDFNKSTDDLEIVTKLRTNTEDVTKTKDAKFSDFGLSRELLKSLYEAGFLYPSPIQKKAIPQIIKGGHLMARAKNGTGKTAAFCIPALHMINWDLKALQVVILAPSRELAIQTKSAIEKLLGARQEKIVLAIGGSSVAKNIEELADGSAMLVGTLGRVAHLFSENPAFVRSIFMVVIDEADIMLSAQTLPTLETILSMVIHQSQILLFSATFPISVKEFSDRYMKGAAQISTMKELTLRGVTPYYVYLDEEQKLKCLWFLMRRLSINQSIIFVNTVSRAELLFDHMKEKGFSVVFIHSKMSQSDRSRVYAEFRDSKYRHLVTTNLFTRGIDIKAVNVVINFDFPTSAETYLHRIGRSGRFGQVGLAVDLVTDSDKSAFFRIKNQLSIEAKTLPEHVEESLYN